MLFNLFKQFLALDIFNTYILLKTIDFSSQLLFWSKFYLFLQIRVQILGYILFRSIDRFIHIWLNSKDLTFVPVIVKLLNLGL